MVKDYPAHLENPMTAERDRHIQAIVAELLLIYTRPEYKPDEIRRILVTLRSFIDTQLTSLDAAARLERAS
jgi:hypothetical protein